MTKQHATVRHATSLLAALFAAAALTLAGCADMGMGGAKQALSGANEVPPNTSAATGSGTIKINGDLSVTGNITASGMTATAAHIHEAAPGKNGPVIVPFTKSADNTFGPAAGAKLTDAQYQSYLAGNLYINVHSKEFPGGEIRAQLVKP
jgi:hypothetical protein